MPKKPSPDDVSIGKFDILATYTYARGLLDGLEDDDAKERGLVAAVMGARARLGHRGGSHKDDGKEDKQVAEKLGGFFNDVLLPIMKMLVDAGLSYDEVKRLVEIPGTWGAKITGE